MGKQAPNRDLSVHDLRQSIGLLLMMMGSMMPPAVASAMADRLKQLSQMANASGDTNVAKLGTEFAEALTGAPPAPSRPNPH